MTGKNSINSISKEQEQTILALTQLASNGILNINDVLDNINMLSNKKILERQNEYCKPWLANDGRWKVKVPDSSKKPGYRLIAKTTRENLDKEILKVWKSILNSIDTRKITLEKIYPEWLEYKQLHSNASSYIKRIADDWTRFYEGTDIVKIPLVDLDFYTLDTWAHRLVKENNMTKTCYNNMAIIMRQGLQYACMKKIILTSPFKDVKIEGRLFRKVKKPSDVTQVFQSDEQTKLESVAFEQFHLLDDTFYLALPFMFRTGIRAGECLSLKFSDFDEMKEGYVHIQRMNVATYELKEGKVTFAGFEDVEHAKTDAGDRNIYVTKEAREIINLIKEWNNSHGLSDEEFVFVNKKGRPQKSSINYRLKKCCKLADIPERSQHKIRKTFISSLLDTPNLNLNFVRSQAGHESEKITLRNYCFNRKTDSETEALMEMALSKKV